MNSMAKDDFVGRLNAAVNAQRRMSELSFDRADIVSALLNSHVVRAVLASARVNRTIESTSTKSMLDKVRLRAVLSADECLAKPNPRSELQVTLDILREAVQSRHRQHRIVGDVREREILRALTTQEVISSTSVAVASRRMAISGAPHNDPNGELEAA